MHLKIKAKNIMANNNVRIILLNLGQETTQEFSLSSGLFYFGYVILIGVTANFGPVIRPGLVMRLGDHAEMRVERLLVGLVDTEVCVEETANHGNFVLMILGIQGCSYFHSHDSEWRNIIRDFSWDNIVRIISNCLQFTPGCWRTMGGSILNIQPSGTFHFLLQQKEF